MDICGELSKAFASLIQLSLKVEKKLPGNPWYRNEVGRLQEEGNEIEIRAREIAEQLGPRRFIVNVPQYRINDIIRDIQLFAENIKFLNQQLDVSIDEENLRAAQPGDGQGHGDQSQRTNSTNGIGGKGIGPGPNGLPEVLRTPNLVSCSSTPESDEASVIRTRGLNLNLSSLSNNGFKTPDNRIVSSRQEILVIPTPATPSSSTLTSPCQCEQCRRHRDPHIHGSPAISNACSSCLFEGSPVSSLSLSSCQCPFCAPEMHPFFQSSPSDGSSVPESGYYSASHGSLSNAASDR